MIVLVDSQGAIERIVQSAEFEDLSGLTALERDVPSTYPATSRWNAQTLEFEAFNPPPRLNGLQILGLYTASQHARARRMLDARFPEGHPLAGELMDPQALVQRLVDATLAMRDPISVADPFHVNGTIFLRGVGVIESDAEAARILAGIPAPGM